MLCKCQQAKSSNPLHAEMLMWYGSGRYLLYILKKLQNNLVWINMELSWHGDYRRSYNLV